MDLSGWHPKYTDDRVLHYARVMLQDQVMFGTDCPMLEPEPWLEGFEGFDFSEEVQRKILWEKAESFLDL